MYIDTKKFKFQKLEYFGELIIFVIRDTDPNQKKILHDRNYRHINGINQC